MRENKFKKTDFFFVKKFSVFSFSQKNKLFLAHTPSSPISIPLSNITSFLSFFLKLICKQLSNPYYILYSY